jgi:hypothetical protein
MENKITHRAATATSIHTNGTRHLAMKFRLLLFFVILAASASAQNMRGLYVNGFNSILGNSASETTLLNHAQANGYNYLCLYSLASIDLTNATKKSQLASFISRAKTQYGVTQVGAAGEIYSFFSNYIIPYNNGRSVAAEKFDVLNFEFEFWIATTITNQYCSQYLTPAGYSCDSAGAFAYAKTQFSQIDAAAAANGMISEAYFGWPNKGQMQWFAQRADRILLHAYRTSDIDIYTYTKNRLIDIASINSTVNVMIIFSSESIYMGPWLESHSITQPYNTYAAALTAETGTWKDFIKLQGYQWFKYSLMPVATVTATITASGPTTFCQGGSVLLSANSGTSQTYQWTKNTVVINGATGITYSASTAGDYAVKVTKAGTTASSAAVAVNVLTNVPQPVISASGPLDICAGATVTLTSSSSTGNLWSNNATTQSITVGNAGNYSVTVTAGSCTATSAIATVTTAATVAAPAISASGPLSFCMGGSVTLTSSSATGNLWSNNATTQSITVSSAGTYSVTVNSGSCTATSAPVAVSTSATAPVPTITAGGPLAICPGGSVTLTSSSATGNLWSNNATTQSITVSSGGTYTVTVTSGTCTAISAPVTVSVTTTPPVPVIYANGSTKICPGAGVVLTSSISSSGVYTWSNGATTRSIVAQSAGTYWVRTGTPTCYAQSANKSITAKSAPATPTITASGPTQLIEGGSINLTSSYAHGYSWVTGSTSKTISVNTAGTYRVTVTGSNGCKATSATKVVTSSSCTPPSVPVITSNSPNNVLDEGGSLTLTSNAAGGYLWSNGQTTQSITVTTPGTYTVRNYNAGYCFSTSLPVTVYNTNVPARYAEEEIHAAEVLSMSLYPNPVYGVFTISFSAEKDEHCQLDLVDLAGRIVLSKDVAAVPGENTVEINGASLISGMYLLRMSGETIHGQKKFMVAN